jgi:hypothetical protein
MDDVTETLNSIINKTVKANIKLITDDYEKKLNILYEYVHKFRNLSKQGSAGWFADRLKGIGGSEIASILNKNFLHPCVKTLKAKLGIAEEIIDDTYMMLGHIMEEVCKFILEKSVCKTIYELSSIPWEKNDIIRYSPDGLSVIVRRDLEKFVKCKLPSLPECFIALLEIKSPVTRKPNDKIPQSYDPQISAGLDIIKVSEVGIFVEDVIKTCYLEDLDYTSTYTSLDPKDNLKPKNKPGYIGMLAFYYNTEEAKQVYPLTTFMNYVDLVYDKAFMIRILREWYRNKFTLKIIDGNDVDAVDKTNLYGIIGWKLFDISIKIKKKKKYLRKYKKVFKVLRDFFDGIPSCENKLEYADRYRRRLYGVVANL